MNNGRDFPRGRNVSLVKGMKLNVELEKFLLDLYVNAIEIKK